MKTWRLIVHHRDIATQLSWSLQNGKLAIGWGAIGDLRTNPPADKGEITRRIEAAYPSANNARLGGPSLWNFFKVVSEGDLVVMNGKGRGLCVFEITGGYRWAPAIDSRGDYQHQRAAVPTSLDPRLVWKEAGAKVAKGENPRWTLACCASSSQSPKIEERPIVYSEGSRYEIIANMVERDPAARAAAIRIHGTRCSVCQFSFEAIYGDLGKDFIHIHHLNPLSGVSETRHVDPERDLVPLCPNCHAMVHRQRPPMKPEDLRQLIEARKT